MRGWIQTATSISVAGVLASWIAALVACNTEYALGEIPPPTMPEGGSGSSESPVLDAEVPGNTVTDGGLDDGNPCNSIEEQSVTFRQQSCAPCHQEVSPSSKVPCSCSLNEIMDDQWLLTHSSPDIINDAGAAFPYVTPGDPENSLVYTRIQNGTHPPSPALANDLVGPAAGAALVYPTILDVQLLADWIDCLGPPPGSGSSSSSGVTVDGAPDTEVDAEADATAFGPSGFSFVVNGLGQTPLSCPSADWEFAPPPGMGGQTFCPSPADAGPCGSIYSVFIVNTGEVPLAYLAAAQWSVGSAYRPGVLTGEPNQLAGVLAPGAEVNITSVYAGGVVALLGSSEPFSNPDANYASDEGVVPWPGGVAGSNGSTQMWIAQISIDTSCDAEAQFW